MSDDMLDRELGSLGGPMPIFDEDIPHETKEPKHAKSAPSSGKKPCHGCHGKGWVTVGNDAKKCPVCNGKGVLT